jgi:hypothetical protein
MKEKIFNVKFVVVGLLAVFFLAALPVIAGEPPSRDQHTLKSWLSTLSEEERAQFDYVINSNIERFRTQEDKSPEAISEVISNIDRELECVLSADRFAAFQALTKKQPVEVFGTFESVCGACYWVNYWAEHGYNYILDAKSICESQFYTYCDPPVSPWGIPIMPCASLALAKIYGEKSMNDFWTAYSTCDCTIAQRGLTYAQRTLLHLNRALTSITEQNCSANPPWKYYILQAISMFNNTVNSAQGCIDAACGN